MEMMEKIVQKIKLASQIAILPHVDPDGDCLGSSFALSIALQGLGKKADVILEKDVPKLYTILPGFGREWLYMNGYDTSDNSKGSGKTSSGKYDTVICLDCSDEGRLGSRARLLERDVLTINMDHHITNTQYAQYNYVEAQAAAAGEIVFKLIQRMGIAINTEIATNLYVAIATDTGSFKYSSTTSDTHRIVAQLLETGINSGEINRKIFDSVSLDKLRLKAQAINSVELSEDGKIAVIVLKAAYMQKVGLTDEDTDGLTSLPRTIEGVEVGILIKEKEPDIIKVSFRSNEYVDVSEIAAFFGGGGHKRASGCTLTANVEQAKKMILEKVAEAVAARG